MPSSGPIIPSIDGLLLVLLLWVLSMANILSWERTKAIVWANEVLTLKTWFGQIKAFSDILVSKTDLKTGWVFPCYFKFILILKICTGDRLSFESVCSIARLLNSSESDKALTRFKFPFPKRNSDFTYLTFCCNSGVCCKVFECPEFSKHLILSFLQK